MGNYKSIEIKNSIDNKMIGRFAALSCSNTANITSYYNGTKYSYIMYKNNGGINVDRIGVTKGDYKNGVEVSVTFSKNNYRPISEYSETVIVEAIKKLSFFKKLHIEVVGYNSVINSILQPFNDRTFDEYNNFSSCSFLNYGYSNCYRNYIRVGNVIYEYKDKEPFLYNYGIIPKYNVGELDITPNREQIQETHKTLEAVKIKEKLCKTEYDGIVSDYLEKVGFKDLYDSLNDYYKNLSSTNIVSFSMQSLNDIPRIKIGDDFITLGMYKNIYKYRSIIIVKETFNFYTRLRVDTQAYNLQSILESNIFLQTDTKLREVTKEYFDSKVKGGFYIVWKKDQVIPLYKYLLKTGLHKECIRILIKQVYRGVITNSAVPKEFIEAYNKAHSKTKTISTDVSDNTIVFNYRKYQGNSFSVRTDKLARFVQNRRETVIYTTNTKEDKEIRLLSYIIDNCNIQVITVPKNIVPYLKNKRNFIDFDDYVSKKQRIIQTWATGVYISRNLLLNYTYNDYKNPDKILIPHQTYALATTVGSRVPIFDNGWAEALYKKYVSNKWLAFDIIEKYLPNKEQAKILCTKDMLERHREKFLSLFLLKKFGKKSGVSYDVIKDTNNLINQINKRYENI